MTIPDKDHAFIYKLYKVTCTPLGEEHSFRGDAEVLTRISSLLARDSRKKYEHLTDDVIRTFVDYLLRLVDTPCSLIGALKAAVPVKCLLNRAFDQIDLSYDERGIWFRVADDWYRVLGHCPDTWKYSLAPQIKGNSIFSTHVDSFTSSSARGEKYPSLYRDYAFLIHKALRFKQSEGADQDTLDGYGLVARDFFGHIGVEYKSRKTHPKIITEDYINSFMRGYDIAEYAKADGPFTATARRKASCFRRLIAFTPLTPREGGYGGRRHEDADPDHDILNIRPPDDRADTPSSRKPRIDRSFITSSAGDNSDDPDADPESEQYEAPLETPVYTVVGQPPSRKPSLKKSWRETINLRNYKLSFSAAFLQLFHYAIIHFRLKTCWGRNGYWDAIIVFLYILIHTGIDEHYLIGLTVDSDDTEAKPSLRRLGCGFYILIPSIILTSLAPEGCLKRSNVVWVPVPEPIVPILDALLLHASTRVFSYRDNEGKLRQLSLDDVDNFLESQVNNSCKFHPFRFSRALICNSFLPFFSHHFGLDPLVAVLVSGRDHHRLYKSQLHYSHVSHSELEEEYLGAFNRALERISVVLTRILNTGLILPDAEGTR